jgi:hypothetical protein
MPAVVFSFHGKDVFCTKPDSYQVRSPCVDAFCARGSLCNQEALAKARKNFSLNPAWPIRLFIEVRDRYAEVKEDGWDGAL